METTNQISVTCDTKHYLSLDELEPIQGKLKELSEERYAKLRKSFLKNGFCAPMFVWYLEGKKFILDGHQRQKALMRMRDQEGFSVPRLPVVPIQAGNLSEAKEKVLAFVSQYGEVTTEGLKGFLEDWPEGLVSLHDYQLPDFSADAFLANYGNEGKEAEVIDHSATPSAEAQKQTLVTFLTNAGGEKRLLFVFKADDYSVVLAALDALRAKHAVPDYAAALVQWAKEAR